MSKYQHLTDHLSKLKSHEWRASFNDIEQVLGFELPASAYQHPAWWANQNGGQAQRAAWQEAGWKTESVDLEGQAVTFVRWPYNALAGRGPTQPPALNALAGGGFEKPHHVRNALADAMPNAPKDTPQINVLSGQGCTIDTVQALTIAQAKAGLAAYFGVPSECIEITIRG